MGGRAWGHTAGARRGRRTAGGVAVRTWELKLLLSQPPACLRSRPVTCSEKAAPSGLWKLGAKTNLVRGLPEGLPHPLLTCRLCFFIFLLGTASPRVARSRPSPPRPTAQRRVRSLDRLSPSRRPSGNSTASAWPRPSGGHAPGHALSASGRAPAPPPGSAGRGLPPASGPGAGGLRPSPRPSHGSPQNPPGRPPPHGHPRDGARPRPTPPPAPGPCLDKALSDPDPEPQAGLGGKRPGSARPNGPAPSSAFLSLSRLLPAAGRSSRHPCLCLPQLQASIPSTSPPRKRPLPRTAPSLASPLR